MSVSECLFSLVDYLSRQSFKRSPTTMERAHFRRYCGRIRELRDRGVLGFLSAEVLSAVQLHTIDKALLPNMRTLLFWASRGRVFHPSQDRLRIAHVLWIQPAAMSSLIWHGRCSSWKSSNSAIPRVGPPPVSQLGDSLPSLVIVPVFLILVSALKYPASTHQKFLEPFAATNLPHRQRVAL